MQLLKTSTEIQFLETNIKSFRCFIRLIWNIYLISIFIKFYTYYCMVYTTIKSQYYYYKESFFKLIQKDYLFKKCYDIFICNIIFIYFYNTYSYIASLVRNIIINSTIVLILFGCRYNMALLWIIIEFISCIAKVLKNLNKSMLNNNIKKQTPIAKWTLLNLLKSLKTLTVLACLNCNKSLKVLRSRKELKFSPEYNIMIFVIPPEIWETIRAWRGFIVFFAIYFLLFCIYYNWQAILRKYTKLGRFNEQVKKDLRTENKMKLRIAGKLSSCPPVERFLGKFQDYTYICKLRISWEEAWKDKEKWNEKYNEVIPHHISYYRHTKVYDTKSVNEREQQILYFFLDDYGLLEKLRLIYVENGIIPKNGVLKVVKMYSNTYVYEHSSNTKCLLASYVICYVKPNGAWKPLLAVGDWYVEERVPMRFYMKISPQVYIEAEQSGYKVRNTVFGKKISKKRIKKY